MSEPRPPVEVISETDAEALRGWAEAQFKYLPEGAGDGTKFRADAILRLLAERSTLRAQLRAAQKDIERLERERDAAHRERDGWRDQAHDAVVLRNQTEADLRASEARVKREMEANDILRMDLADHTNKRLELEASNAALRKRAQDVIGWLGDGSDARGPDDHQAEALHHLAGALGSTDAGRALLDVVEAAKQWGRRRLHQQAEKGNIAIHIAVEEAEADLRDALDRLRGPDPLPTRMLDDPETQRRMREAEE